LAQECRVFNDSNVVTNNPKRCCQLITKLLHLLTQGETFTSSEVTDVFFGVTKLFQSKDHNLRRMM
jgi:coatomer subunit gamma